MHQQALGAGRNGLRMWGILRIEAVINRLQALLAVRMRCAQLRHRWSSIRNHGLRLGEQHGLLEQTVAPAGVERRVALDEAGDRIAKICNPANAARVAKFYQQSGEQHAQWRITRDEHKLFIRMFL
jgi:hypothetical protein